MTRERPAPGNGRPPRRGYTTGSCAALAAGAAARLLLSGRTETGAAIVTPGGKRLAVELAEAKLDGDAAVCAVRKDAGDDPDVTNGVLVYATARKTPAGGVTLDGGDGVGRVTRPGLDLPPGSAAINPTPRRMIEREVAAACREAGYAGGMSIVVSIPGGAELAARTYNPNLGIVGGLSVIGTTGIVEPMSERSIVATTELELRMLRAEGVRDIVMTPGNYGETFVRSSPRLANRPRAKCSNHIGEALDLAGGLGFASVLLVGHVGKLVKLAGGVMNTHSRVADCRMEFLALEAALAGADTATVRETLAAATADAGLDILEARGFLPAVMAGVVEKAERSLLRRAAGAFAVGAILFSRRHGVLGMTKGAGAILAGMEAE